jgi:hypothetical protein
MSGNTDIEGYGLGFVGESASIHQHDCRMGGTIHVNQGGKVLLTGSNSFEFGDKTSDPGQYRPVIQGGKVYISAGAILNAQAQSGYLMDCQSVEVGSGDPIATWTDDIWTVTGSATLIMNDGSRKDLIGSGQIIDAHTAGSNAIIQD